jgi:hypothetical protein
MRNQVERGDVYRRREKGCYLDGTELQVVKKVLKKDFGGEK